MIGGNRKFCVIQDERDLEHLQSGLKPKRRRGKEGEIFAVSVTPPLPSCKQHEIFLCSHYL